MGDSGQVAAARKQVKKLLGQHGRLRFLTPAMRKTAKVVTSTLKLKRMQAFILGVEPLMGLTEGIPTDAALHSTWWPAGGTAPDDPDPDTSAGGIVFAAPIVPLDGAAVQDMLALTERVAKEFDMHPAVTLNLMSDKALEGVVSLDFKRDDSDDVRRAHECIRALNEAYIENGYTPYRIDIGNMDLLADPDNPFWRTVNAVKRTLDPNNILAPGRYGLG